MSRDVRLRLSTLAAALVLAGCSMIPTYERPAAPVPQTFPLAADTPNQRSAADTAWQDFVRNPQLRELIERALANNRDLRVATLNIERVRAQYQIARANQYPTVNAAAIGNRQGTNGGSITSTYSVGLAVSAWEIDFFGRLAALKEAALADYLASEQARHAAQTSLISAVASSWLSLQTNEALLAITRETQRSRDDSLRLTRLRFDNGAASALDLRQAESLAATARASLAQQQRARALDANALTLLVGDSVPASLVQVADGDAAVLADVPAGLPSDLLTRRADIRQAEQALIAANANIGAARAAFFPRISLTASVGTASTELSGLFKDGSWGFTLNPQALLPIFDAGRNRAGLESAKVSRDIAVAQYEKAIQTAFREVADALAGRATLGEQLKALDDQVTAESDRLRLAELRYRNGVASFLDVLDAQRSLFTAQQSQAQIRLALQQNRVALYAALGGGWTQ
ncbi:MAG: efflux transporter outer membrane subunit [Hydrogenophaga sp.]|uniref:efflux transporter outer membrane subunit n=1 Tax=Hydrogenophaga sp. TaxID=1904254 RepID=UPI001DDE551F|nr:efflux transporter outer membrane subunit [Hydrogenophaga sp.]MBX3609899.1 efflux transporter outer membrane subunit [Hydrogenophaga sp.]